MAHIDSIDFKNKRALIRVDFNVPLDSDFNITDNSRINAALPTIKKVLSDGGSIVLMSHLGRPKNGPENTFSLKHLVQPLSDLIGKQILFSDDCISSEAIDTSRHLAPGEIHLLENLRFYKEETAGDLAFSKKLSEHGDIYINDAFGTAHRAHASTAIIAQYFSEKCFGYLLAKEIENATQLLANPKRPFTAIVGGAKVSDKILIIENLLTIANHIIIGGGMAYTFIKAMGGRIGNSLCEDERIKTCHEILAKAHENNVAIHLPLDSVIADDFNNNANTDIVQSDKIPEGWMGLDAGPKAIEKFSDVLASSKTILWNGPLGVFEMAKFEEGTKAVGHSIAKATQNGAFSLIGGGDSSAAVKKFGLTNSVSYVSTGGGALLEFFEGKTLPGIAAINA